MPTTQELKARVEAEIDRQGQQLIATTKTILNNPEPGFREVKTARTVAENFQSMGIPYEDGIGITGLKGMLRGGASGPTVAVMGELDSLKVLGHPHADPETTAAHACGHHCQIGMMLAVAGRADRLRRDGRSRRARRADSRSRRGVHRDRVQGRAAQRGQAGVSGR